jgi:hypothetical protein
MHGFKALNSSSKAIPTSNQLSFSATIRTKVKAFECHLHVIWNLLFSIPLCIWSSRRVTCGKLTKLSFNNAWYESTLCLEAVWLWCNDNRPRDLMTILHSGSALKVYSMCHIKTEKLSFDVIAILKTLIPVSVLISPQRGSFLYFWNASKLFVWVRDLVSHSDGGYRILGFWWRYQGARGGAVGWGTALQTGRSRIRFIRIFHWHNPSGPGVDSASNRNEYQEYFLGE